MSKFNPDFWEVAVAASRLEAFSTEDALWSAYSETRPGYGRHTQKIFRQVLELMRTELTQRQREVVQFYYFGRLTEVQIAERLGIPQQVVSQHLHGVMRQRRRARRGRSWRPGSSSRAGRTKRRSRSCRGPIQTTTAGQERTTPWLWGCSTREAATRRPPRI